MTRICTQCDIEKEENEFYLISSGGLKRRSKCKLCVNAYSVARRRTHPPRLDPIKARARRKRWEEARPEWRKEYLRSYNQRPEVKERRNKRLRESGKGLEQVHKRIALRKTAEGSWTAEEWKTLCDQYGNKCLRCGKNEVTIDHVVPLSLGGSNSIDNLQPLCQSCNCSKQATIMDYRYELPIPV